MRLRFPARDSLGPAPPPLPFAARDSLLRGPETDLPSVTPAPQPPADGRRSPPVAVVPARRPRRGGRRSGRRCGRGSPPPGRSAGGRRRRWWRPTRASPRCRPGAPSHSRRGTPRPSTPRSIRGAGLRALTPSVTPRLKPRFDVGPATRASSPRPRGAASGPPSSSSTPRRAFASSSARPTTCVKRAGRGESRARMEFPPKLRVIDWLRLARSIIVIGPTTGPDARRARRAASVPSRGGTRPGPSLRGAGLEGAPRPAPRPSASGSAFRLLPPFAGRDSLLLRLLHAARAVPAAPPGAVALGARARGARTPGWPGD